jgi:sensor histidine kinase regulating citrate/malate metabolism
MENFMIYTKNRKLKIIIIVAVLILISLIAVNVIASYMSVKKNVELSIASQSVRVAKEIGAALDAEQYKRFLNSRSRDEDFWEITSYLNDSREKTGALYVYTFEIESPQHANSLIVAGFEDDAQYTIGIPCTIPEAQLRQALKGKTYFTSVIEDQRYGTYISAGAPIQDEDGTIIGYVGIDMDVQVLKEIEQKVFQHNAASFLFSIVFVMVLLMAFYSLQKWYGKELKKELGDAEATYQEELHSLFDSLRSLRHDYLNHIQVVHGLLKIGKHQMAAEYMDSLVKEAKIIDNVPMDVDHPALLVLFQAKKVLGQTNKVSVEFDVDKDSFEKMKTTDLIKILSNLIDNAIDASLQMEEEDRMVKIFCKRETNHYVFKVENSGPAISEEEQKQIFRQGYSTKPRKSGKIRGQGLSIIQETTKKYKGMVLLNSSEERTTFEVRIPIHEQL